MTYSLRLAVVNTETPTISVEVSGTIYPEIPLDSPAQFRNDSACPQWSGGVTYEAFFGSTADKQYQIYSNYPSLYSAAYSTNNLLNDYIGVEMYSFSAGNTNFVGGEQDNDAALMQPMNVQIFGDLSSGQLPPNYGTGIIIPSLASTLESPEALIFVRNVFADSNGRYGWAGLKVDTAGNTLLRGLFSSPTDGAGDSNGTVIYAAVGFDGSYYVLRDNWTDPYAFTVCTEQDYPAPGNISYFPGFDDPDLPGTLAELAYFQSWDVSDTYRPVSIHCNENGFLVSYKQKILGTWYPKFILVDPTWSTFQWVEFTSGNSLGADVITQSELSPFTGVGNALNPPAFVSAYYKNNTWYLLGGTFLLPNVATSAAEDYGIVKIASTAPADAGFFYDGISAVGSATAIIDGAFFGFIDLAFPLGMDSPDDCTDLVVVGQALTSVEGSSGCEFRSWTYTMDGHDFYVLRLGCVETLVYDTHAEQWYQYATGTSEKWRLTTGINWIGGESTGANYGSNILVGDDSSGVLYFLDPTKADDDNPDDPEGATVPFERVAQGQITQVGRDFVSCFGVQLIGSQGDTQTSDNTVNLKISDDSGHNYVDCGNVDITYGSYGFRTEWLSLGSIRMPGRLFKITDYGALIRIDGLELLDGINPESR